MPSLTVLVDGLVPPARLVIGCPASADGWGGWTVARLKDETQKRLLDIYHCDQSIATLTDEAGGALYGPDKLADLGVYPGTVLRALPVGARPYLEVLPAADEAGHAPAAAAPVPTAWALDALDRAIAEKDAFIDGLAGLRESSALDSAGVLAASGGAGGGAGGALAGQDVLAAIDRVMAQREGVLGHLDQLAAEAKAGGSSGGAATASEPADARWGNDDSGLFPEVGRVPDVDEVERGSRMSLSGGPGKSTLSQGLSSRGDTSAGSPASADST
jgi:hypothetical protein